LNILIANATWYPSGGDWTYIENISKIYESKGHSIIPFAMKDIRNYKTKYDQYFINNINYNDLNTNKSFKNSLKVLSNSIYSFDAVNKLNMLLNENTIDIAQLNNIHNIHTPGIINSLKKHHIPIVWRILDYKLICPNRTFLSNDIVCEKCFKTKYYNCFFNKCKKNSYSASLITTIESYFNKIMPFYNYVDTFIFQSEFSRDLFIKYGFDIKKTAIIENPFYTDNINQENKIITGEKYVLYFGRISREKGLYTLYKAMLSIPDIKLLVVGDGPDLDDSKNYVKQNNITNIEFKGPKWGEDLIPYIQNCEFVIVPSEWYEPNPYVVLQSFSYGKTVVASNIGGLKDMIINNENGILFEPNNSNNLSSCIEKLYFNNDKIIFLGENAKLILKNKYSPDKYYNSSMKIFTNLINKII
jgi:glycosyltransferase involved in cell wall biosynthesis